MSRHRAPELTCIGVDEAIEAGRWGEWSKPRCKSWRLAEIRPVSRPGINGFDSVQAPMICEREPDHPGRHVYDFWTWDPEPLSIPEPISGIVPE